MNYIPDFYCALDREINYNDVFVAQWCCVDDFGELQNILEGPLDSIHSYHYPNDHQWSLADRYAYFYLGDYTKTSVWRSLNIQDL